MRSLQFGGEGILRSHARLFNCAFSPIDRIEFFREYFFLLLAGTGCGFSVQRHHIERLPAFPARPHEHELPLRIHAVVPSMEGWADALHVLLRSYLDGWNAHFDYTQVQASRPPWPTAGSFTPGPEPLRCVLADVSTLLRKAVGRRLRPVEVYDLCMFVSRAVLSDSARRSASICLFSADDIEMVNAKTGRWQADNPQRTASNNSAVFFRTRADEALFRRLLETQKEFGEPGFYFSDGPDYGCNPCGEAGLHPVIPDDSGHDEVVRLRALGYAGELPPRARLSGWQMCNLTTINGTVVHEPREFFLACVHAAVIGTLQAAYTDMPYLGPVTRVINERDALLGVSVCGFMDNPEILFAPTILERGARICRAANQLVAATLGIRPAARVTCVKPEGTASLLLGSAAGIHPRHAHHYFRRVQADRRDPVYRQFRALNSRMTEPSRTRPASEDVIVFPVEAPAHAVVRDEIGAVDFLTRVLLVQQHWVLAGEAPGGRSPGLHHNVSHTCPVRSDEWDAVADFVWESRDYLSGVAFLGDEATERYAQAPYQALVSRADVARWNALRCQKVDYSYASASDERGETGESDACVAGACGV
jgi:ribonucleoside-diphosphate reductase alpha chain